MAITIDTVVESYVQARNQIKELENKISEIKGFQAKKEEWLQQQLEKNGIASAKTPHGTVYTTTFESVTVADAEAFFTWVKENNAYDFLEKRASKAEVLNYMGENDNGRPNPPPPGLNYLSMKKIGIRKS